MTRWSSAAAVVTLSLALASPARADKDRYEIGEDVKSFTLKVVNPEEVGEAYIGVDRYFGADAKEPKKAILLSFFATYCEPCKREMPYLAALYEHYKDKGLMILSVSIDKEAEKIEFVKDLAAKAGAKFPVLSDRFNIVAKRYFISQLPCVYLVGADGKVAMVEVGYNDDISRNLLDNVRKAVGEPTTDPIPPAIAAHLTGHSGSPETVAVPVEGGAPAAAVAADADADPDDAEADGNGKTKAKGKKAKTKKAKGKKAR